MQFGKRGKKEANVAVKGRYRAAVAAVALLLSWPLLGRAQSPAPAASGAAKSDSGLYPGWNMGVRFEGSTSGDGSVYDLGFGAGYNFARHFGIGLGAPYYFVGTPSAVKSKDPQAVSGSGIGDIGVDLRWLFPGEAVTYGSTVHLAAPSGDTKKGLSTGHGTWNWANHIDHGWGNFTPFIDGGVGNSLPDSRYFHRPYVTFGYNMQFEAGTEYDSGPFSISGSAYDIAPWGNQTMISRVFRCPSGSTCSSTGTSTDRKGYLQTNKQTGGASLTRDNGFNAGVEVKPTKALSLEFDYSRSVPLRLNSFSFGIGVDVSALLRGTSAKR